MKKQIFITGTDTEVGKTTVSEAISFLLKENGYTVGYYKPVETGCEEKCNDAYSLSKITGQELTEILSFSFKNPVAPLVAERIEKKRISIKKIIEDFSFLKIKYDYLIVEGAGGILVPITKENGKIYTYLDLVSLVEIPALVVSRAGLGTINHTVLTVEALKNKNIKIKGIVMNGFSGENEISENTNPQIVEEMTNVSVIAKILKSQNPFEESVKSLKNVIWEIFK